MSIKIKDLREKCLETQTYNEIELLDGIKVNVGSTHTLKQRINLVDRIVDLCIEKEGFFNSVKLEIITQIFTIQDYTNLIFEEEDLEGLNLYKTYDALYWSGALEKILPLINDYFQILNWAKETAKGINQFYTSFTGTLVNLSEMQKEEETIKQFQEIIDKIKESNTVQKIVPLPIK